MATPSRKRPYVAPPVPVKAPWPFVRWLQNLTYRDGFWLLVGPTLGPPILQLFKTGLNKIGGGE